LYPALADSAYKAWTQVTSSKGLESTFSSLSTLIKQGDHYFITNPVTGSGISPKWDFTHTKGPDAFVVGARVGGLTAPTGSKDIDWLQLSNVQGKLTQQIYRVDTRGGQPPTSVS
jgi:hypothetical protein